jgi:hypothetical protein
VCVCVCVCVCGVCGVWYVCVCASCVRVQTEQSVDREWIESGDGVEMEADWRESTERLA